MKEYHKIDTVFKRDMASKHKTLLFGEFSQDAFGFLAENEWVFTEKVDGTNIRIMIAPASEGGGITFGGKTDNASIPAPLVARLQAIFLPRREEFSLAFPDGGCLYGEGYGGKIQNGGKYRMDQDFVLFDVKVGDSWLRREAVMGVAGEHGLDCVPIVGRGTIADMIDFVKARPESIWGPFECEGVVARPRVELRDRRGARIITKLKCRDFAPAEASA